MMTDFCMQRLWSSTERSEPSVPRTSIIEALNLTLKPMRLYMTESFAKKMEDAFQNDLINHGHRTNL